MPRIVALIVLVLVLGAVLFFFSSQAEEVPPKTVETDVSKAPNAS